MSPKSCEDDEVEFGNIVQGKGDETDDCDESWESIVASFANAAVCHIDGSWPKENT